MSPELRVRWRLVPRWLWVAVSAAGLLEIGWSLFCTLLGLPAADRPPVLHLGLFLCFYAWGLFRWFLAWNLSDEAEPWLRDEPEEVRRAA